MLIYSRLLISIQFLLLTCSTKKEKGGLKKITCINHAVPAYILPFPVGKSYYLLQGNCSSFSHFKEDAYAFDLRMPIGTYVTAMRSGKVVNVREQYKDEHNSNNDSLNFIIILHDDSTASRYLHITQNGALVDKGQYVHVGDTIALSGNTGLSSEPHLHVDVTGYCTKAPCQTIPFSFINCTDKISVQGKTYEAKGKLW